MSEKEIEHGARRPRVPDDEIDLVDLWLTLVRRRILVATVFVVVVGIGAAWAFTRTPVYEAAATLELGQFDGAVLACPEVRSGPSQGTVAPCIDVVPDRMQAAASPSEPQSPHTRAIIRSDGALTITTSGQTPDDARDLAARISDDIVVALLNHYQSLRTDVEERLLALDGRLSELSDHRAQVQAGLNELDAGADTGAYALALLSTVEAADLLLAYEDRRKQLEETLAVPNTVAPELVAIDVTPVEPKLPLVGALSLVLGLMLAILSVFVAEFFASVRERARAASGVGSRSVSVDNHV